MTRTTWIGVIMALCMLGGMPGCSVGDPDFDGGLFDDDDDPFGRDGAVGDTTPTEDAGTGPADPPSADAGDGARDAGGDGGGDDPRDLNIAPEDWPAMLADAVCGALEECLGVELLADAFRGRDCRNLRQALLESGELGYLSDSVEAGLVTFVPGQTGACLSDLRSMGCAVEAARMPRSCRLALTGNVALDGDCSINADCAGEASCARDELATCPGFCSALQPAGFACTGNDDAQCEDGLICFQGSCEPLGEASGACGDDLPVCRPGLLCLDDDLETSCEPLETLYFVAEGEACERGTALCAPGLVCESTSAGIAGVCRQTVGEDQTCLRADPNECPFHQYCDAEAGGEDGVCRDRPAAGEPCLDRAAACDDGHRCIDDICVLLQANGGDCEVDQACYSGLCEQGECTGPLMCDAP